MGVEGFAASENSSGAELVPWSAGVPTGVANMCSICLVFCSNCKYSVACSSFFQCWNGKSDVWASDGGLRLLFFAFRGSRLNRFWSLLQVQDCFQQVVCLYPRVLEVAEYWVFGEAFYDEADGDGFVLIDVTVLGECHACSKVAV